MTYDDFKKVEMKIGEIISAEKVEKSEKLLKLSVNFGEVANRQVISGIASAYPDPAALVGRKCIFVTNLEPRLIMGLESQAMILASKNEAGLSLVSPVNPEATPGDILG